MWLVDSCHGSTAARAYSGCGKIVKVWPVSGNKKDGDDCFSLCRIYVLEFARPLSSNVYVDIMPLFHYFFPREKWLVQVITNAISFANRARFSICRWAVQSWFCFRFIFKAYGSTERKDSSENRNAVWKTHNWRKDSNKPIGSFCRLLSMYWTDFSEISAALLRSCNWRFEELTDVTKFSPKLVIYSIWWFWFTITWTTWHFSNLLWNGSLCSQR